MILSTQTSEAHWVEEARRMRQDRVSYELIARRLGRSEYSVRGALIPGEKERRNERKATRRLQERGGASTMGLAAQQPRPISLPKVSLQGAQNGEAGRPALRIAPKTRFSGEKPGVAAIREIHRRMIRAGKISGADLLSEMRT